MPLKCACGCGQDIPDGAPYVGVPLNDGTGNWIAFLPEHHQGVQADFTKSVTQPEPVYADNPLTTKEEREIKAKAREHYRKSAKVRKAKTGPEAQMLQKGVDIGMSLAYDDVALGYGKFAQMAKGRRRKKNPCGRRRRRLKKNKRSRRNPGIPYKALYVAGKRVEKKTKIPMSGASLIGKVAGKKAEKETVKAALGATGTNPNYSRYDIYRPCQECAKPQMTRWTSYGYLCKRCERRLSRSNPVFNPGRKATLTAKEDKAWTYAMNYYLDQGKTDLQADKLAWRDMQKDFPRLRKFDGATPGVRKNSQPGFINTHNAQVTEVRYREFGTGERFKHKLVRPVRMKKRGSRIIIPPMKVKPEGITQ